MTYMDESKQYRKEQKKKRKKEKARQPMKSLTTAEKALVIFALLLAAGLVWIGMDGGM